MCSVFFLSASVARRACYPLRSARCSPSACDPPNPGAQCGDIKARKGFSEGPYGATAARGTFVAGGVMDVQIKLTAHHSGWFEFRLAVPVNASAPLTQELLNAHVLQIDDSTPGFPDVLDYQGLSGTPRQNVLQKAQSTRGARWQKRGELAARSRMAARFRASNPLASLCRRLPVRQQRRPCGRVCHLAERALATRHVLQWRWRVLAARHQYGSLRAHFEAVRVRRPTKAPL